MGEKMVTEPVLDSCVDDCCVLRTSPLYGAVILRTSPITHRKNIFTDLSFFLWKKNERKPEKTCIIAVKCRRDCHLANQEGCFSLLKPCFPSWNRFLLQVPVKFTKMKKKPVQTCLQVFFSGQNSDRFQDRPVKTGNRTCNRFLDRTECRGQI